MYTVCSFMYLYLLVTWFFIFREVVSKVNYIICANYVKSGCCLDFNKGKWSELKAIIVILQSQGTSPLPLCSLLHVSPMDTSDKEMGFLANQTLEYLLLSRPLTESWKENLQRNKHYITACFFTTLLRNQVFYISRAPACLLHTSWAPYLRKFGNQLI